MLIYPGIPQRDPISRRKLVELLSRAHTVPEGMEEMVKLFDSSLKQNMWPAAKVLGYHTVPLIQVERAAANNYRVQSHRRGCMGVNSGHLCCIKIAYCCSKPAGSTFYFNVLEM